VNRRAEVFFFRRFFVAVVRYGLRSHRLVKLNRHWTWPIFDHVAVEHGQRLARVFKPPLFFFGIVLFTNHVRIVT